MASKREPVRDYGLSPEMIGRDKPLQEQSHEIDLITSDQIRLFSVRGMQGGCSSEMT